MQVNQIIKTIDAASILTEFGIIKFGSVFANREFMSNDQEFRRAVGTLSDVSERIHYNLEYKGMGTLPIEPRLSYGDLQRINTLVLRAYEPENLKLIRSLLSSETGVEEQKRKELCEKIQFNAEELNYFYIQPDQIDEYRDNGLGTRIPTGRRIENPKAGVVSLSKEIWFRLVRISNRYRRQKHNPEEISISTNANGILDFVRSKVDAQISEKLQPNKNTKI